MRLKAARGNIFYAWHARLLRMIFRPERLACARLKARRMMNVYGVAESRGFLCSCFAVFDRELLMPLVSVYRLFISSSVQARDDRRIRPATAGARLRPRQARKKTALSFKKGCRPDQAAYRRRESSRLKSRPRFLWGRRASA